MSLTGTAALVAVVSLLVVVSLPRLRSFALQENESDARSIARLLAGELGTLTTPEGEPATSPPITSLVARDVVERSLYDAELLAEGEVLRRHGYLFTVVALDPGARPPSLEREVVAAEAAPRYGVLAWPWERGRTGDVALLATSDRRVFVHENERAEWSGPGDRPRAPVRSWAGWRPVP